MRRPFALSWILASGAFFSAASSVYDADAKPCASVADCPRGFECLDATSDGGPTGCVSLSCASNTDCAPDFACFQDIECVPGPDASRVPGGACVPQWQAPCHVDSDCGDGFQCVFGGGACDCSGTGKNVPPDAGATS